MKFLLDPFIFNYIVMVLYVINGLNYLLRKEWGHASYWFGAFWITASVTFGMRH